MVISLFCVRRNAMDIEQLRTNAFEQGKTDTWKTMGTMFVIIALASLVNIFLSWKPLYTFSPLQLNIISAVCGIGFLVYAHRSRSKLRQQQAQRQQAWKKLPDQKKVEVLIDILDGYLTDHTCGACEYEFNNKVKDTFSHVFADLKEHSS